MSTINRFETQNRAYLQMAPFVEQIRDIVRGSPFIKMKEARYLPHPSSIDSKSLEQRMRYRAYIDGAEFDDFTSLTKRTMLGKLDIDNMKFTPADKLEYLIHDVDKDGLSMRGLYESCAGNILEVKWHLLLADYKGLSDLPIDEISKQDVIDANPRATIKQYPRESVVDWDFARINGTMQLTYLILMERSEVVNQASGSRETVTSYIKLGLDEEGYYQQKSTDDTAYSGWGEKLYLKVNGKALKFIPASIACDEEFANGDMPRELGFLAPIGELALYRYRVSAKYKEAMDALIPTLHISGVNEGDWEIFKEVNGRDYVASGAFAPNIWPNAETKFELLEAKGSLEQFSSYFEENKNKVRARGGVFKTDQQTQRTATEVIVEAETATSVLLPIANNIESALKWQVAYCAMFEGLVSPENIATYAGEVELDVVKEFSLSKLSTEEVKTLMEVYMNGLMPKDELLKILDMGGWLESDAETLLNKLEEGI